MKQNEPVFLAALKECTRLFALREGRQVHADIIKNSFERDEGVGSALINMYAKCGSLQEARFVFDKLQKTFALSWNVMTTGYILLGNSQEVLSLFCQMLQTDLKLNHVSFLNVLKACSNTSNFEYGKLVHDHIIESGFDSNLAICNTLIDMYYKCGDTDNACGVFARLSSRDVVSWNAMISGIARQNTEQAFQFFEQMQREGRKPDAFTYISILKASGTSGGGDKAKLIHTLVVGDGFETDGIVGSSLMDVYAKFGHLNDAHRLWDKLLKRDVVAYNSIIAGYAQHGQGQEALSLFVKMRNEGKQPDEATLVSVLKACTCVASMEEGKSVHSLIIKSGHTRDLSVGSTLMNMYTKFGTLKEACRVFDNIANKDVVAWNILFTGFVQSGQTQEAFHLFQQMLNAGLEPNNITYVSLLKGCSSTVAQEEGKWVHGHIVERCLELDDFVGNALVNMYIKCKFLDDAYKVFEQLQNRTVVSWSAMIAGYGLQNEYKVATQCFEGMQREGLKPDDVAFVNLLSACSHKGLVKEGFNYFKCMIQEHDIKPLLEHYTCMADLLSRAGLLMDAESVLKSMPCQSNLVGWMSLLSNCRSHGKVEIGRHCFDRITLIDRNYAPAYTLMSSIYINAGMPKEADNIEEMRKCCCRLGQDQSSASKSPHCGKYIPNILA